MLAAPPTVNARKSAAAFERAAARRRRARAEGFVAIAVAAYWLKVDRRVLERLHTAGEIPGRRAEGEVQLSRHALAAYCWSRPRCIADDCGRRVIGTGPGCSRHRRHGRRQSEETRRKKSEALRSGPPVERVCEWCGHEFELSAALARKTPGRFCSLECLDAWLQDGADADGRRDALDTGLRKWRSERAAKKAELERQGYVVGVDAVVKRLPRQLHRSPHAVSLHLAAGLLEPALRIGELRLVAFREDSVVTYRQRLESHGDGRLGRFNASTPERAVFVRDWTGKRHGGAAKRAVSGRLAAELAAVDGKAVGRPSMRRSDGSRLSLADLEQVGQLLAMSGWSQQRIANKFGVSRDQVKRFAAAGKKLGETH
jgi:hypothetical protein